MIVTWSIFKSFVTARSLSIQYLDLGDGYWMKAFDGLFSLELNMPKDDGSDQIEFETTYKALGNKSLITTTQVNSQPPFGSKTLVINGVTKKLFARFTGQQYNVDNGTNTLTYTATYAWAKMLGIEVINALALDTAELKIFDDAIGTYSGVPNLLLNQFAYTLNLNGPMYSRMAQFDADLFVGMVIKITYVSSSLLSRTVGINFLLNEVK